MEGVNHRTIATNGINMHIAEMGSGPVVLFLHGFPECWYSWRKQMSAFSEAGFHAVAPDLRGYGDTDSPQGVEKYTVLHIVGDLIGLLDSLQRQKVFVVSHGWGAIIGWYLCLFCPERILALAALSVHYRPHHPAGSILHFARAAHGENHYLCKFQEPGKTEAMIANISPDVFYRRVFCNAGNPNLDQVLDNSDRCPTMLPDWVSEEDIEFYVKAQKSGFTPPLNYYRALDLSWELTAPWAGSKVMVPTLFMIGDKDLVYSFSNVKEYLHGGGFAKDVPNLKECIVLKDVGHFLHEEKPEIVNRLVLSFFKSFHVAHDMRKSRAFEPSLGKEIC